MMNYIYDQGFCDQATRDKDWIAYGDMLLTGREPIEEYDRMKGVVASFLRSKTKAESFDIAREHGLLIAPARYHRGRSSPIRSSSRASTGRPSRIANSALS